MVDDLAADNLDGWCRVLCGFELEACLFSAPGSILVGRPFNAANPDKEYIESSQQLAQAYADIATRQPVLEGVVDDLGLSVTWMELRDQVSVEIPADNPQLIEVAVEASSPEAAKQASNQLLDRILQLSQVESQFEDQEIQEFVTSRLETLQEDIRERQRRIDELERALSVADPEEVADLTSTDRRKPGARRSMAVKLFCAAGFPWRGGLAQRSPGPRIQPDPSHSSSAGRPSLHCPGGRGGAILGTCACLHA